jgi:hypothetical protein
MVSSNKSLDHFQKNTFSVEYYCWHYLGNNILRYLDYVLIAGICGGFIQIELDLSLENQ